MWRDKAIDRHGDWLWELKDQSQFAAHTTRWTEVLWQLELARSNVLDAAGSSGLISHSNEPQVRRHSNQSDYRNTLLDPECRPRLPLGLHNRLRIWCCLKSIGKDGTQVSLQGQAKGLDPPGVEWDGISKHADCTLCGRVNAISFDRLQLLAGRTDLT